MLGVSALVGSARNVSVVWLDPRVGPGIIRLGKVACERVEIRDIRMMDFLERRCHRKTVASIDPPPRREFLGERIENRAVGQLKARDGLPYKDFGCRRTVIQSAGGGRT